MTEAMNSTAKRIFLTDTEAASFPFTEEMHRDFFSYIRSISQLDFKSLFSMSQFHLNLQGKVHLQLKSKAVI